MKRNHRALRSVVVGFASVGLACMICLPAAAADSVADQVSQIETIVVTAQLRSEKLKDVPLSVRVMDGRVQAEQNINSLQTLSEIEPSIHVGSGGRNSPTYMRGIGSGENQSFDQAVGTFIDGIYHGRSRGSLADFLDLDRVEMLKGPQSTFFGNNAIAGAFNIVTKKPTDEFDASARAFYSWHADKYTVEVAAGGPINDTFGVRAAVIADGQEGWIQNVNTGEKVPNMDNIAGRLTLLFKPNKDLDATVKLEQGRVRSSGLTMGIFNCPPPPPFVVAGFCPSVISQGLPTGIGANTIAASPGQALGLDTKEAVLTLNYRLGGHTLTSITGYSSYDYYVKIDAESLPQTLMTVYPPEQYHQASQEFRITSPAGQAIEYLAGAYFQTGDLSAQQDFNYSFLTPVIKGIPPFAGLIPYLPFGQNLRFKQAERTSSLFGSLSWNATDRLKLTGGLRGSRVTKDFSSGNFFGQATQDYGGIVPLPVGVAPLAGAAASAFKLGAVYSGLGLNRTDSAWMPSAKVQYVLSPASMAYASYSKGFLAGGFNGTDSSGIASRYPFAPEYVNAYEAGIKNQWDNFLLNFALFRSDYSDLQVAQTLQGSGTTFISVVSNAARAVSQGLELEGQWKVSSNFRLATNLTLLDSTYSSFKNAPATALQTLRGMAAQDLSGRPTPFAPRWSGSLTGTYKTRLANGYRMTGELSSHFSSSYYLSGVDDDLLMKQGRYVRLDGRLTFENNGWAVDLIGHNLNKRKIQTYLGPGLLTSPGSGLAAWEEPRSIGVQLRYHW